MSWGTSRTVKSEHNGAKNHGGYWGPRAWAKARGIPRKLRDSSMRRGQRILLCPLQALRVGLPLLTRIVLMR